MSKKLIIGLVAVVALASASYYFSGTGGGLFQGKLALNLKPAPTTTTVKPVVTAAPTATVNCKDLSAKFAAIQIGFIKEAAPTAQNIVKLRGFLQEFNVLMESEKQNILTCDLKDYVKGLHTSIENKLISIAIVSMSVPEVIASGDSTAFKVSFQTTHPNDTYLTIIPRSGSIKGVKDSSDSICQLSYSDAFGDGNRYGVKCKVPAGSNTFSFKVGGGSNQGAGCYAWMSIYDASGKELDSSEKESIFLSD